MAPCCPAIQELYNPGVRQSHYPRDPGLWTTQTSLSSYNTRRAPRSWDGAMVSVESIMDALNLYQQPTTLAAAVTFLIYDIILTIDDEVSASVLSIWRKELWALMLLLLKVRLIWP